MPVLNEAFLPIRAPGSARRAQISQDFHAPGHLGCDLGWPWQPGDPTGRHERSKLGAGPWVQLEGSSWVASLPSLVLYSEAAPRGWTVRLRTQYGVDLLYMHGVVGSCHLSRGDFVAAGTLMALVGYDPTDAEGWSHLHFETRIPARDGASGRDDWGYEAVDPSGFLRSSRG